MTPAEIEPYINARVKREEEKTKMENERIGLICSVIQNGVPIGYAKSGAKKHKPSDYFGSSEPKTEKKDPTQQIFETMNAWCSATKGCGISG
jgi:hypothetical protein